MASFDTQAPRTRRPRPPAARGLVLRLREEALGAFGRPALDPTAGHAPDPAARAATLAWPAAQLSDAVLFTPRSGSSRLAEVLRGAGTLGRPGEAFNPDLAPAVARAWGARDLADYVGALGRRRNVGDAWGFKATWRHLRACVGTPERFAEMVAPDAFVCLVREDIAAQAVSAARMVRTGVPHAHPRFAGRAAVRVHVPSAEIALRVLMLRRLERDTETLLDRLGARALRLSHERALRLSPAALAALVARHVGADPPTTSPPEPLDRRLATDASVEAARRFRGDHPAFMRRIDRARAPMLARLDAWPEA